MSRTKILSLLLWLPLISIGEAHARPYTVSDPAQMTRVGGAAYTVAWNMSTSSQMMHTMNSSTGAALPLIVPWDTVVILCADAEVSCAWVMSSSVSIGPADLATTCEITDSAYSRNGPGACMSLPAAGCTDDMPQLATIRNAPGAREGVCDHLMSLRNGLGQISAPCRLDADCSDAGHPIGTTCDTTPSDAQMLRSGAMLECRGPAAAHVTVRLQR